MSKMTLKELAEYLELSVSTVSRALNDSYEISEETKERVRLAAKKFDYRPNLAAKGLKTGKSNSIGLIIPYLSSAFQSQILEGAQQTALAHNVNLIFMQSRENENIEKECFQALIQQNIDGIIIAPSANSSVSYLKQLNKQVPLVLVDRIDFELDAPKIGVDSEFGAYQATKHLLENGRKEILVLAGKNLGVNSTRILGYKKALQDFKLPFHPEHVIQINHGQESDELMNNLKLMLDRKLKQFNQPIGLLGITDTLTVNSLGVLHQLGKKVPQDVSVIGFANLLFAESLNPPLSCIVQPAIEMGRTAVEELMKLVINKYTPKFSAKQIILKPDIILRNSSFNVV